jgi:FAD binding domain
MPMRAFLTSGYIKRGDSPRALVLACGIDAEGLDRTLRVFNASARHGEDPQFQRGSDAYQRFNGAPTSFPIRASHRSSSRRSMRFASFPANLAPLPALPCASDRSRRVALEGLYAVGNDATSVMGGTYPGAGITIGPAMTFGYVAVRHLAASQNRAPTAPNNGACVGSAREQRVEFADRVELIKLATAANMGLPDPNLRHAAATIGFARHLLAQG